MGGFELGKTDCTCVVLQVAPRQVRTELHNILQIRLTVFSGTKEQGLILGT